MSVTTVSSSQLLNPVVIIALILLLGVTALLGLAVFGKDVGRVLFSMARPEFARGLITYLFTVVTIGCAIVIIISGLTTGSEGKEQFERGKEVLGLLLGVFGTMVGFYFGSEKSQTRNALTLSQPLLGKTEVKPGETITITAFVQGGHPPYRLGLAAGAVPPTTLDKVPRTDGWIVEQLLIPPTASGANLTALVVVQDSLGEIASAKSHLTVPVTNA